MISPLLMCFWLCQLFTNSPWCLACQIVKLIPNMLEHIQPKFWSSQMPAVLRHHLPLGCASFLAPKRLTQLPAKAKKRWQRSNSPSSLDATEGEPMIKKQGQCRDHEKIFGITWAIRFRGTLMFGAQTVCDNIHFCWQCHCDWGLPIKKWGIRGT